MSWRSRTRGCEVPAVRLGSELVQSWVVERLSPEEERDFRAAGRPLGGSGFTGLFRKCEPGLRLLNMLKKSLDRREFLRPQPQPSVLVLQNVHLIMLPAEFTPQIETALLERNADQRNQHDDADSTAEAEEHGDGGREPVDSRRWERLPTAES